MYPDRQTPPNTRNQSYLRRKGVVNHVPGLKRKGCPGTLKPLRLRRGRRAAACMERCYTGPFEGPPIIKPPALPEDIYFIGVLRSHRRVSEVSTLRPGAGPSRRSRPDRG